MKSYEKFSRVAYLMLLISLLLLGRCKNQNKSNVKDDASWWFFEWR